MKYLFVTLLIAFSFAGVAQPKTGEQSPEITLKDVNGQAISLSSLKGKVVLIDFWASWCGPCRKANKYLVSMYSRLRAKGFEIYGISIDDDQQAWKKAIAADKIKWLQVNEKGGWDAPVASRWKIDEIPTNYLLDKNGKIIAKDLEGRELENAVIALLK